MHRIFFNTRDLLIAHAKQNGGWCAMCDDGNFQWFQPGRWTLTEIIEAIRGTAEIGPWTRFSN